MHHDHICDQISYMHRSVIKLRWCAKTRNPTDLYVIYLYTYVDRFCCIYVWGWIDWDSTDRFLWLDFDFWAPHWYHIHNGLCINSPNGMMLIAAQLTQFPGRANIFIAYIWWVPYWLTGANFDERFCGFWIFGLFRAPVKYERKVVGILMDGWILQGYWSSKLVQGN